MQAIFNDILVFVKRFYIPLFLLLALCFVGGYCYSTAKQSDENKQAQLALKSSDSIVKSLKDSIVHDTTMIHDTLRKVDTLWRIRTLILSKVDSSWMKADSAIALVPASDSACHTAYNTLKSGCELLKTVVKQDSNEIANLAGTLGITKTTLVSANSSILDLQHQLSIVSKYQSCKILFVHCPSRTLSFFLGIGVVEAARIGIGHP